MMMMIFIQEKPGFIKEYHCIVYVYELYAFFQIFIFDLGLNFKYL